jgi:GNAT superfamily N-acetyltransferase
VSLPILPAELLSRVEDAGLNASAPPQQRWIDGWLVRFSPGKAQRARCINAVSTGRLPLSEKLALCQALYRDCGLRMVLRITPFSQPEGLDEWLAQRGYQRFDDTRVMVCAAIPRSAIAPVPTDLQFEGVSSEAYAHIVGEFRGTEHAGRQAHAQRLVNSPVPYRGFVLRSADGSVLACAQVALEADMVGLYDVFTAAHVRGRGLSRWLCTRLLTDAREHGARLAYLQVDTLNRAARSVYQGLGFADAYSYHYRALPRATG